MEQLRRCRRKKGPDQDQSGSDGIGDTPYVFDWPNRDRYPLMNPLSPHQPSLIPAESFKIWILGAAIATIAIVSAATLLWKRRK